MNAVDTNVLIYAHDPRDPVKQQIAQQLVSSVANAVLLWQVAVEYLAGCRKLEPFGYTLADGWRDIGQLQQCWSSIGPNWNVLIKAEDLLNRFSLSFWDALIVASCIAAGVTRLCSEDFGGNPRIDSVEIVNPFAP
jgi:predicted nucleic acid-binding protein